jgi:hypothetical protein
MYIQGGVRLQAEAETQLAKQEADAVARAQAKVGLHFQNHFL